MHRKMVGLPLLIQTRRKKHLWTVARLLGSSLLLKANSSMLLMQLMVRSGIELLMLAKVTSLELHLLLRKMQLKLLLLLGLQELHLEMLLRTPMTLLLLIHRMIAEHRLAKSHQLLLSNLRWQLLLLRKKQLLVGELQLLHGGDHLMLVLVEGLAGGKVADQVPGLTSNTAWSKVSSTLCKTLHAHFRCVVLRHC